MRYAEDARDAWDAWDARDARDARDAMRGTFVKVPLKLPSKLFG